MAKKKTAAGISALEDLFLDDDVADVPELKEVQAKYRVYSTGFPFLDWALNKRDPIKGNMGIVQRTIMEVYGMNQSLKTAISEQLTKNILADEDDNRAIYLNFEESSMTRWDKIGVPLEHQKRIITLASYKGDNDKNVETGQKCLDRICVAVQDPRVKIVVIDSIKSMPLLQQVYAENGDIKSLTDSEQVMLKAKMIESFLMKFKVCNKHAILYMANQMTDNVQMTPGSYYANPKFTKKTTGGRNMEFECHLRIENTCSPIYHTEKNAITDTDVLIGWELSSRIIKNKFCESTANRVAEGKFYFNPELMGMAHAGFDRVDSVLTAGEFLTRKGFLKPEEGVVVGGGGYYTLAGEKVRGEGPAVAMLRENAKLLEKIEKVIAIHSEALFNPTKVGKAIEEDIEGMF